MPRSLAHSWPPIPPPHRWLTGNRLRTGHRSGGATGSFVLSSGPDNRRPRVGAKLPLKRPICNSEQLSPAGTAWERGNTTGRHPFTRIAHSAGAERSLFQIQAPRLLRISCASNASPASPSSLSGDILDPSDVTVGTNLGSPGPGPGSSTALHGKQRYGLALCKAFKTLTSTKGSICSTRAVVLVRGQRIRVTGINSPPWGDAPSTAIRQPGSRRLANNQGTSAVQTPPGP